MKQYEGYYSDAKGMHPWQESDVDGGLDRFEGKPVIRPIKARSAPETVRFDVPTVRRRSAQERLAEVTKRIYDEALRSYAACGKVMFPTSVLADIQQAFWAAGEPVTLAQIEALTAHEIRPLCEKYAAMKLQEVHRKGQANEGYAFGIRKEA